jgi:hypothetical protein
VTTTSKVVDVLLILGRKQQFCVQGHLYCLFDIGSKREKKTNAILIYPSAKKKRSKRCAFYNCWGIFNKFTWPGHSSVPPKCTIQTNMVFYSMKQVYGPHHPNLQVCWGEQGSICIARTSSWVRHAFDHIY